MHHEEASALLAVYVLDAVDPMERAQIEEHLAQCPRCRAEVDAHREVAAALGNSVEALPDGLWSAISSRLGDRGETVAPPMPALVIDRSEADADTGLDQENDKGRFRRPSRPSPTPSWRTRVIAVAAVAVGAAALAAVLGVALVHDDHRIAAQGPGAAVSAALATPGHRVVNLDSADQRRLAQFVVVPSGQGYLVSSSLPALSSGRTYQLWGVFGTKTISLGLLGSSPHQGAFSVAGSRVPSTLAITVEPVGGSVVPTTPMVATGRV